MYIPSFVLFSPLLLTRLGGYHHILCVCVLWLPCTFYLLCYFPLFSSLGWVGIIIFCVCAVATMLFLSFVLFSPLLLTRLGGYHHILCVLWQPCTFYLLCYFSLFSSLGWVGIIILCLWAVTTMNIIFFVFFPLFSSLGWVGIITFCVCAVAIMYILSFMLFSPLLLTRLGRYHHILCMCCGNHVLSIFCVIFPSSPH